MTHGHCTACKQPAFRVPSGRWYHVGNPCENRSYDHMVIPGAAIVVFARFREGPVMTTTTEHRIQLPITKPLSLNERLHWAAKNRRTQEIRNAVALLARRGPYKIPHYDRITVQLEWRTRTAHRRDGDNLAPTVKAAVDGLRDAKVIDDDDTEHVTHLPVVILPPVSREPARLWIVVRPIEEAAA